MVLAGLAHRTQYHGALHGLLDELLGLLLHWDLLLLRVIGTLLVGFVLWVRALQGYGRDLGDAGGAVLGRRRLRVGLWGRGLRVDL